MNSASGWCRCEGGFDYDGKSLLIDKLEAEMASPTFWDSPEKAQSVVLELKNLRKVVDPLKQVVASCSDLEELAQMADEDPSLGEEISSELLRLELATEQPREGGLDANDWAEMLLGMYTAWAQQNGYSVELLDRSDDETAGITQATIVVRGEAAYGYLKGEEGIHRLVRISPYNAEGKRQTSFAAVDVSPEIDDSIDIDIAEKDVREDVFRASGAGGQHVNKTSSAIRLTHIPTGIAVQCQNERSQHKNRAAAWKMLRSRLARIEEEKREAQQMAKYQSKSITGFGSQIRNYFLHPDQRVKDARTGFQMGNFHTVLGGDIQGFLEAFLRYRMMNMQSDS